MHRWQLHRRRGYTEIRPYVPGEDLTGIGVPVDVTPREGGMIARDPLNSKDQWYVTPELYAAMYEPASVVAI